MRARSIQVDLTRMRDDGLWNGSFNGRESPMHQLSPYVGKLKTGMVHALLEYFSKPGHWVCDPFAGSGVVPLEALLMKRRTVANDLSLYAHAITLAKLTAPFEVDSSFRPNGKTNQSC